MKLDVNMEFKRSLLAATGIVCATVLAALKVMPVEMWMGTAGAAFATYFTTRTVEEAGKRRNAHEAFVSDNMRAARDAAGGTK